MLKKRTVRFFVYALLAAFALWLPMAACDVGGQRSLFYREGTELLSDFWMPRTCLSEGYSQTGDKFPVVAGVMQSGWLDGKMRVLAYDRCYPATALIPLALFPESWPGAWAWTVLTTTLFLTVLCLVAQDRRAVLLVISMPVLYGLERGNVITLSAASVGAFLAWYRSERQGLRVVAALALGIAVCLKVSPVLLGGLYLREGDWKGLGWFVLFSSILFVLPWCFVHDGFSALPVMVVNARDNMLAYVRASEFGLIDLWRTLRVVFHQDCMHVWPGCLAVSRVSQVLGFVALARGIWGRDMLWVVLGMMWAAGNMHYYGVLYLVPVFLLELKLRDESCLRLALWFVILCPFQFVLFGHSANGVLCNLVSLGLLFVPYRRGMI